MDSLADNGVAMAGADVSNVPELKGADVDIVRTMSHVTNKLQTDPANIKDGNSVVICLKDVKEKDITIWFC